MLATESGTSYQIQSTELMLLLIGVLLLLNVYHFELDFAMADFIYDHIGWRFKQSFIVEGLLHKCARVVLIAIYLGIIFRLIKKKREAGDPAVVYNLFILVLAIGSSVLIVSITKRFLNVDCPWDLIRYGGDKPYFSLFNYSRQYLPSAHCFPASHASVGSSWIALFFYYKVTQNSLKFKALGGVLCLGLVFGFAQQLRGAHFISHDLWSFLICLSNSIIIYKLAYRNKGSETSWA